jgi:hypothetical protein
MENKRWCKIEGYDNYSVSDYGNVRNDQTGRILKGGINSDGYHNIILYLNGKKTFYKIHRLVATYFCNNENNYNEVDHIDCNKINNHYKNLRWVTPSQNNRNKLKKEGTSSKYLGVLYHKRDKKWQAQIRINYKKKHLGYFDNEEDAYKAFRDAVEQYNLQEFYPPENNLI